MTRPARLATLIGVSAAGILAAFAMHASVSDASTSELAAMTLSPGASDPGGSMIIGVGVHRGAKNFNAARSDQLVRQMGFDSIRDELGQSAGNVRGGLARSLALGGALSSPARSANAANVYAATGGGSAQYPGGLPLTDKDRQSYFRFLSDLGPMMSGSSPIIEIWNEWNLSTRLRKAGTPETYAALVNGAVPALRSAFPQSTILAGSIGNDFTGGFGGPSYWDWTRSYLQGGSWKQADGLSVHLYANCMKGLSRQPVSLIQRLRTLDGMIRANNGGRSFPVYVTEVGWPARRGACGFDDGERAAFPSQFLIMAEALPFVRGVWLYELQDRPGDQRDTENTFGLTTANYTMKPSSCPTVQTIALLKAYRVTEVKIADGLATASLQAGTRRVQIAWSADGTARDMPLNAGARAQALCSARAVQGGSVRITSLPQVIYTGTPPQALTS